jgi:hypothetical protein
MIIKSKMGNMAMIALGQSKNDKRPIAGILHVIGFYNINIELLEIIIIDGVLGLIVFLLFWELL